MGYAVCDLAAPLIFQKTNPDFEASQCVPEFREAVRFASSARNNFIDLLTGTKPFDTVWSVFNQDSNGSQASVIVEQIVNLPRFSQAYTTQINPDIVYYWLQRLKAIAPDHPLLEPENITVLQDACRAFGDKTSPVFVL